MVLTWIVPDTRYDVLSDGWTREPYRPRHGKPPLAIRTTDSATAALRSARERYLGAADDEPIPSAARPAS